MQDGMHTHNINCCRTLFFTTSKLLFIPLWQSWDCLLGSLCCQVCSGQTASSCCTFKIHRNLMHRPCSRQWLNMAGDWSQPVSAQCRTHLGAGFTLELLIRMARPSEFHCCLRLVLLNPLLSLSLLRDAVLHLSLRCHWPLSAPPLFILYLYFPL